MQPIRMLGYDDLPELYHKADAQAGVSQRQNFFLLGTELILAFAAALAQLVGRTFGTDIVRLFGFQLGGLDVVGRHIDSTTVTSAVATSLVPAVLIVGAAVIAGLRYLQKPDARWHSQRALAEATAGLAWRYSMRAMKSDLPGHHASGLVDDAAFNQSFQQLVNESASLELAPPDARARQISPAMRELRSSTDFETKRLAYLKGRLEDQCNWYARKASAFRTHRNRLRWLMILMYGLGVVLLPFNGLGVMTTASGGLGTWLAGKHYDDLYQSYSSMARKLQIKIAEASDLKLADVEGHEQWAKLVDDVESLFEGEHGQWQVLVASDGKGGKL